MMEFQSIITNRYSVRNYRDDPVEDEKLHLILEAARLAPTASNRQPFQLVVVHTAGREDELSQIYRQPWFVQAPVIICVCGIPALSPIRSENKRNYLDVNVGIIMDHMILAAASLGLGTCMVGAFYADKASQILGLPDDVDPILFTTVGYADNGIRPKERKPLSDLVRYEHW